jgi:hypothetical protein
MEDAMTLVPTYAGTHVSTDISVGRILPKFVTPADVRDLKTRVDAFVRGTDQAVADCSALPAGVRTGWEAFSKAWRAYFDEEDSWWHTAAQMDQGEAYERDLARWQDTIAQFRCSDAPPRVTPSTDPPPPASDVRWQGTIKTVAIAGAVIAVALGLRAVLR